MSEPDRIAAIRHRAEVFLERRGKGGNDHIRAYTYADTLAALESFVASELAAGERERDELKAAYGEMSDMQLRQRQLAITADAALLTLQRHVREVLQQIRHIQVPPSLDEPFNHGYIIGRADAADLVAALLPSLAEKEKS